MKILLEVRSYAEAAITPQPFGPGFDSVLGAVLAKSRTSGCRLPLYGLGVD